MTDCDIALEVAQVLLGEHLEGQPHALVRLETFEGVPDRHAGALLTAMLEGEQAEIGDARHIRARGVDTEDSTFVAPVRPTDVVGRRATEGGALAAGVCHGLCFHSLGPPVSARSCH